MVTGLVAAAAALSLAAAEAPASPGSNPIVIFFHAADAHDVAGMQAILDRGSAEFIKKVDGCYLRRMYGDNATHQIMGVWMCALGANRSRVVVAHVSANAAGKVAVSIQADTTNERPAPERTGSAFAEPGASRAATRPDFSDVRSRDQAERLAAEGKLVKMYLFPTELGGQDDSRNVVFVPPATRDTQRMLIGTLQRLMKEGQINKLTVDPAYRGDSLVPTRVVYHASHSQRPEAGQFEPAIEIW